MELQSRFNTKWRQKISTWKPKLDQKKPSRLGLCMCIKNACSDFFVSFSHMFWILGSPTLLPCSPTSHPPDCSQELCQLHRAALSAITLMYTKPHTHTLPHTQTHTYTLISVIPAPNYLWCHNGIPITRFWQALWSFAPLLLLLFTHFNEEIQPFSASRVMDDWHLIQRGAVEWEQNETIALSCWSFAISWGILALENTCCILGFLWRFSLQKWTLLREVVV